MSNDIQQKNILEEHFCKFYNYIIDYKIAPEAEYNDFIDAERYITGISYPFLNTIVGYPKNPSDWDSFIQKQIDYFAKKKLPFSWFIDENVGNEFKEKLRGLGFIDTGIFQGVIGKLDSKIHEPNAPKGLTIEMVSPNNKKDFNELGELICDIFGMQGDCRGLYKEALKKASQGKNPIMYNWAAKKDGKIVAAVSTYIENDIVSFWNGATLPELRKQGISTAIRQTALKHALSKGCKVGASYLMAEGLALGICKKLGYQTKWRFNTFVAPQ